MFGCGWVVYARWWLDLVDLGCWRHSDCGYLWFACLRVVCCVDLPVAVVFRFGFSGVACLVCGWTWVLLVVGGIVLVVSFHYG